MESAINRNEYNLMGEYDFSKPINATIIFDSDEDETNTVLPKKQDREQQKVTKYLDMPSLDEQNSRTETNLDDLVTVLIKEYISKTKNTSDIKSPKRNKSITCNNTIKNKLNNTTNDKKEERSQPIGSSSSSSNNYKNCPLVSFSAEPSGQLNNVSNDICESKNNYDKKPPKRKSSTTSNNTIKKTNGKKEIRSQHNEEHASRTSNNNKNGPLASFSAEPSGQFNNVPHDICESKNTYDKKPLKRKSSTTSNNTIKKTNGKKEIRSQHNEEHASRTSNNNKNGPLASFSAEPSGQFNNVSHDICESKNTYDKKPLKRKSSTTSNNTIKKTNGKKEIRSQHNEERASSTSNNYNNCPLPSLSAEPSGPRSNVCNDIKSQSSSIHLQPILSDTIEPKTESKEDSDPSNYLSEDINNKRNISTPHSTDNSQPVATSEEQPIEPIIREFWTFTNIGHEEIGNQLYSSTSNSLPTNAPNRQPIYACIELKAEVTKDSKPEINLSYAIINQQHTFSTSDVLTNSDNRQSISASIEQEVTSVEHPSTSANDVSEEISNGIDNKIGDQSNTSISILPPNTDSSCTFKSVSEEVTNPLNTSSSSSPTNTNNILVSTNTTSNIQTQQNNNSSVTYAHLKPLLDTVSEHLILIWNRMHTCNGVINNSVQKFHCNEELRKIFYNYKLKLFDLSYSTVVNVILPRADDRAFLNDFMTNTVALSKCNNRQTAKEISSLYWEMIQWTKKMKQRITSESDFESQIMRQSLAPTGTNTSSLSELVNKSTNPHSSYTHTYSIRPPETHRPPPRATRSNPTYRNYPSPPYTNNTPPQFINTMPPQTYINTMAPQTYSNTMTPQTYINTMAPQTYINTMAPQTYTNTLATQTYINTMAPQTYINNPITPEQTKVIRSTHNDHQLRSTKPMQKKTNEFNKRQQVELTRREVNPSEGPRQDSNNIHNVTVSSHHVGGTYQHYQSTTALPNPNHAQTAHCIMNCIPANNSPYPRTTTESEYQKFLRAFKSRSLPNNSQNHCYRANDTSTQGINNYANNAHQNQANNIPQESVRSSISRDSGFYSPRDYEQEPSTSPLITHVTSLNPDAVNIINGSCSVCGKNTNQKCIGCYATYYCSYGCQNLDWRNHMASCNTSNQELRRLLSKGI